MSDAPQNMTEHYREQERQRILDMNPGPEMDREVAVKVFKVDNPDPRWSPSTDIATAWEVVEELRDKHNLYLDIFVEQNSYIVMWKDASVEFGSIAEAISKAALLARLDGQD